MNVTQPTLKKHIQKNILVNDAQCSYCNAALPRYANFCGTCGRELENSVKVSSRASFWRDVACVLLPICAIVLWSFSLHFVNIRLMTDLGLVSVLPASIIISLLILTVSFCMALNQERLRVPILLLHFVLLIFMLYGITTLVEEMPRFSTVYRHAGYTEYIMRTGTVDPGLDAYFNWPGFFIFSAFMTRIAGYTDILGYAAWAPVFLNLIYLGPIYIIFTTATKDKRVIWLGLWFFCVTNWIAQDYFSPQGLNFFMYLIIIAILLKWFKTPVAVLPRWQPRWWQRLRQRSPRAQWLYEWLTAPDTLLPPSQPRQRPILLASVLIIFAFVVFSHPLTPFLTIASVTALVIFGRCTPRWLPVAMVVMTAAWLIFMAQPYLSGHIDSLLSDIGRLGGAINDNVTSRAEGDPEHTFIAQMRIVMTLFIWGLAFAGAVLRLRKGYHDVTYVLLAVAPFPVLVIQSYGGEMLLRIYLFTLPAMVFFAASLFYTPSVRRKSFWMKGAAAVTCIVLLGGFLFTRYGNERSDYVTNAELTGVRELYSIAPPGSLLVAGWDGTPWQFQGYEQYNLYVLSDDLSDAVVTKNVPAIVQRIESMKAPKTYLIFTRAQKATAQSVGLPPDTLDQLEHALLASGKFAPVYSNADAQIFLFTGGT